MPTYSDISQIPQGAVIDTWKALGDRLMTIQEMQWIKHVRRYDISALRKEDSPTLCIVKVADDWTATALMKHQPPRNVWYDFGLRLYVYDGRQDGEQFTTAQTLALYDQLESANELMLKLIGFTPYMACHLPYWNELRLVGGEGGGRTAVIGKDRERLYITSRLQILRHFRPGQ